MLQMHRLKFSWTDRKSKFSPNARRKLRNTSSKLIKTEVVYENLLKRLSRSKMYFIALKQKNFIDEINNFFINNYQNRILNYVKLTRKVSMKWKK